MMLSIEDIQEQLEGLDFPQSLSFCYLLSKKAFPDYAVFSEFEDFGKPEMLYTALVELRKTILGHGSEAKLQELATLLWEDEELAPDTDDFPGNLSASLALNAVSLLYHSLRFALTQERELLCRVAKTSLNSVEMSFVVGSNIDQNLLKEKHDEIVNGSFVVQSELLLQKNLIEKIKSVGNAKNAAYTHIKTNDSRLAEQSLYPHFIYT